MMSRRIPSLATASLAVCAVVWLSACGEEPTTPVGPPPPPANQAPVASVGANQVVSVGFAASVEGSGTDADGDPVTLAWSISSAPAGSAASLSATDTEMVSITPDLAGDYVLQLIVNDGTDDSPATSLTITANDNTASAMITAAAGGTIMSVDGMVTLDIPAGALAADTEISMTPLLESQIPTEVDAFDPANRMVYELQPDGLQFSTPARISFTESGAVATVNGEPEAYVPVMINIGATDATFLDQAEGAVDFDSGDATWSGDVSHFSSVVWGRLGIDWSTLRALGVPDQIVQDLDFDVTVEVRHPPGILINDPVLVDHSGPWIFPVGGTTGPFTMESSTKWTNTHAYRCEVTNDVVDTGTYKTRVQVTLDASQVTVEAGSKTALLFQSTLFGLFGELKKDVLCTAPPPPPPGTWLEIALSGTMEALNITRRNQIAMTVLSAIGFAYIHDDVGAPVAPVAVPASVTNQAVFHAAGAIAGNGSGALVAAGAEGTYVRGGSDAVMAIARAGRALDCFMQELISSFLWACAGFEDREVVFLESDGDATPTVNTALTDLFKPGGNSVFGTDRPVSVWFGPDGFTATSPLLVATITDDGTNGHLWVAALVGGAVQLTQVQNVSWPEMRKIRCAVGLSFCALSAFGNLTGGIGKVFPIHWDGATATAVFGGPFLSVGKIIGVDVHNANGNALVVTADHTGNGLTHNVRVEEWIPVGNTWSFNRLAQVSLPFACKNPTNAQIRPYVPGYTELLVACAGDMSNVGRVVSVTYQLPTS